MASAATQRVLSPEQHALNRAAYARMMDDSKLAALEGLIESDQVGNPIVSPPPSRRHSHRQGRILTLLTKLLPAGVALAEYPISTPEGVKGCDVVWLSPERAAPPEEDFLDDRAPELCIEVMSPANSSPQIRSKVAAYFASGAREVWVCDHNGTMAFYAEGQRLERSRLCPEFPGEILPS
jgi:Uma2 family endonuclease